MPSIWQRVAVRIQILVAAVLSLSATGARAQSTLDTARSESESGLILSADVFCSETKLRTANVRVQWSLSPGARSKIGPALLGAAKQSLDTTVFAGGFEKGLYVTLPVPASTPPKPVPPVALPNAPGRQTPLRAYQIQLIQIQPARTSPAADSGEFAVVIENLEPGVNYTWRLTIETPSGKLVSGPITVQAPTCPADMVGPKQAPREPR
jgi:hypothetical protein